MVVMHPVRWCKRGVPLEVVVVVGRGGDGGGGGGLVVAEVVVVVLGGGGVFQHRRHRGAHGLADVHVGLRVAAVVRAARRAHREPVTKLQSTAQE